MFSRRPADPSKPGTLQGEPHAASRPGTPDPETRTPADPTPPLDPEAVPRICGRCAWQSVDGETVLLDVENRRLLGLNAVGSFLFGLIDGSRCVRTLADLVAARFAVAAERALRDVQGFVATLTVRGLLEQVPQP